MLKPLLVASLLVELSPTCFVYDYSFGTRTAELLDRSQGQGTGGGGGDKMAVEGTSVQDAVAATANLRLGSESIHSDERGDGLEVEGVADSGISLSLKERIAANTHAYARGEIGVPYITQNPVFQEFELKGERVEVGTCVELRIIYYS